MYIKLKGMDDAQEQLERIERGSKAMQKTKVFVGSWAPYAYGIETGRHKNGRLARRAGGARYFNRAISEVLAGADADMSEGLNKVTAPGPWVLVRLGRWARRLARLYAPKGVLKPSKKSFNYRLNRTVQVQRRVE